MKQCGSGARHRRCVTSSHYRHLSPGRAGWRLLPVDVCPSGHTCQLLFPLPLIFFITSFHGNGEVMTGVQWWLRRQPVTLLAFPDRHVTLPRSVPLASLWQGEDLLDTKCLFRGGTRVWYWEGPPCLLRSGWLRLGVGVRSGLKLRLGLGGRWPRASLRCTILPSPAVRYYPCSCTHPCLPKGGSSLPDCSVD